MVKEQKQDNYISLQEATKYCSYSQEYLSLRARQGKLRAIKIGRNWVAKKEWLDAYMASAEGYKNNIKNNGKKIKKLGVSKAIRKEVFPPKNLPIGKVNLVPVRPIEYLISEFFQNAFKRAMSSSGFRFGFAWAMVLVLMVVAAGLWGKDSLKTVTDDVANVMLVAESKISEDEIYSAAFYGTANVFKNYFKWVEQNPVVKTIEKNVKFVWQNSKDKYIAADRFLNKKYIVFDETIFDSWGKLTSGAEKIVYGIKDGYFVFVDGLEKIARAIVPTFSRTKEFVLNLFRPSEIVLEKELIPESAEDGLVVIPSTEKDEEIKIKIKESFSDEVEVEQVDKTSGTITPVFREREGGKYMYILVPVKN